MIGYGLEPFVPQDTLDRIADAALPGLQNGDPASAILAALVMARMEFAAVSQSIAQASGENKATHVATSESDEAAFAY